jgi:hypothetical protein
MLIELSLGGSNSGVKVIVIENGIDHFVPVVDQVSWFNSTGNTVPTVKEEYFQMSCSEIDYPA